MAIKRYERVNIGTSENPIYPQNKEGHFYMVNKSCRDCYGRGYVGFNIITKVFQACKCVRTISFPINFIILGGK